MRCVTETLTLVGQYSPASIAASTVLTGAIALAKVRRLVFVVQTGVLGTSATVDFAVHGATSSGGSYAAISGAAITQLVKASNDNNVAMIELSTEYIQNLALSYTHVKGSLTIGTAASVVGVQVWAQFNRYGPAEDNDLAAVVEIVRKVN